MSNIHNFIGLIIGGVFLFVFFLPCNKMMKNNNPLGALVWFCIGCAAAYYAYQHTDGITFTPNYETIYGK